MNAIECREVRIRIDGRNIIPNLSIDFPRKSLVGIVGPNGAGKTTFARALLRLVDITSGSISIFDKPITNYHRSELAKKLSYLPQEAPVHWPILTKQAVALGRFATDANLDTAGVLDASVKKAMKATDTFHLRDRSVRTLSGGEFARVMMARALAPNAPILIVDEPIASLDPYHQLHVMEILRQSADEGATVLAILHDLTLASRFCDRIVLMKDGKIEGDGPPNEVLRPQLVEDTYEVLSVEGSHEGEAFMIPWSRRRR